MRNAIILCAALMLLGCSFNRSDVTKYYWKYQRGEYIKDVLAFDTESFTLDDSFFVYQDEAKIGKIIKCSDDQLVILLLNNKKGYYVPAALYPENKTRTKSTTR